jgi:multiple sugar transport system permease protein
MKKRLTLQERRGLRGYAYIAPFFIGFLLFNLFPIIFSLFMSFTNWDAFGNAEVVGIQNYVDLFTDDQRMTIALSNTFIYMVVSMITGIVLSLIMAAVLCEKIPGNQTFRVVFYLPFLVIPVAFGMMMKPVFGAENYGLINSILKNFGIKAIYWLEDPKIAIWTVVFMNLWFTGGSMIIFLAGIKGIPTSYFEAAEIDGAGWWRKHVHITLPLLGPVIFFQVIMGLIGGLQIFDIPASLAQIGASNKTSMGIKDSLATLLFYLYFKGFRFWEMGAASAIGWVIFIAGLSMTIVIIWFIKRNKRIDIEI